MESLEEPGEIRLKTPAWVFILYRLVYDFGDVAAPLRDG
jgi:hypothetical protein